MLIAIRFAKKNDILFQWQHTIYTNRQKSGGCGGGVDYLFRGWWRCRRCQSSNTHTSINANAFATNVGKMDTQRLEKSIDSRHPQLITNCTEHSHCWHSCRTVIEAKEREKKSLPQIASFATEIISTRHKIYVVHTRRQNKNQKQDESYFSHFLPEQRTHTHARTRKFSSYYAGDCPSFNLLCLFSGVDLAKLSQIKLQEIHGIRWQTNFSHKILSIFIYNENDSWTFLANAARENYKNVLLSFCFG